MSIIALFFILILETFAVLLYALTQRSSDIGTIFFGYSKESIVLISLSSIALIFFIFLLIMAFKGFGRKETKLNKIFNDERSLWIVIYLSLLLSTAVLFLFMQGGDWLGRFSNIYVRIQPNLVWLTFIFVQIFLFSLFWYCIQFTGVFSNKENQPTSKDFLLLAGLFIFFFLVKYFFFLPIGYGLFVIGQYKYFLAAKYLNAGIFLQRVGSLTTHDPFLYSLSLMFSLFISNNSFSAIKILNALFTTSALFPIFLISRQLFDKKISYAIVIITSIIPLQFLVPIQFLSENLYFPLMFWGLYFIFISPDNPKFRFFWDCLTGIWIGLLYLCRFITLAAIPFLLLVWWLKPFDRVFHLFQIDWRKIRNLLILVLLICLTFSPWVLINLKNGFGLKNALGFGIAENTNSEQLSIRRLIKWFLFYLAYFILLASPVLNLLFLLPKPGINDRKLKLWYILVLALSLAFLIASVRHSWRAFYNSDLPFRIMGRYLTYFPALFLITSMLSIANFDKSKFKNFSHFAFISFVLPVVLIAFSYLLLIKGSIVPVDPKFILLSSFDVYYIKILGIGYFIIICLLYITTCLFLWKGFPHFLEVVCAGFIIFYLAGQPKLIQTLISDQYYQEMGAHISSLMANCNKNSEKRKDFTVYLPKPISDKNKSFVKDSIIVRNLNSSFKITEYLLRDFDEINKGIAIIVYPFKYATNKTPKSDYLYIKEGDYVIELLSGKTNCTVE
jgi:hypothetical protein